ncbi:MAG: ATP-binding cassette domain-containing protein [Alphaproteobacteria bacterium]|nr:ATP-binding cassette domain-containing protein [Alphaproteobacteria bacterium]
MARNRADTTSASALARRLDAERAFDYWGTLKTFLPYLWPRDRPELRVRVGLALVALLVAKIVTVCVPFLYAWAVDALSPGTLQTIGVVLSLIVAYGVARILMQAFAQLRDAIFAKVAFHAVQQIAGRTFRHLHALSLRFHLERRTGGLQRVIDRGTKAVDSLLTWTLFSIAPTAIELVLVAGILYWQFNIWFALITVVTVGLYFWFTVLVTNWRVKYRREMNDSDTEANTKAVDSLLNFETVKYFNNEAHEANRFDKAMENYARASVKTQTSLSLLNTGQAAIMAVGLVGVMALAASEIMAGRMTIGGLVAVNAFLAQLYVPLNLLGTVYREIQQALIDMEKMFDHLQLSPEIEDRPGAKPLEVTGGEIRFENVVFAYDADRTILHGISFTVPAGKTVAIVGPSGAGKSTISRILYRFYEVESGRVLIDGQDIAGLTQKSLRAAIGIVPQDTVLFNDTIRYNIRYGRIEASDAEVETAARMAQIEQFIRTAPKGFETMVGERGLKLSGGEKQRVAIARTILKNPPILMLDEATSALDTHTEREIQQSLREISRDRTSLVIAHRLSTVVDADEILVLDKGRIVERGRHEELLRKGGAYAAMWNRQKEAAEARDRLMAVENDPAVSPEALRVRPQSAPPVAAD